MPKSRRKRCLRVWRAILAMTWGATRAPSCAAGAPSGGVRCSALRGRRFPCAGAGCAAPECGGRGLTRVGVQMWWPVGPQEALVPDHIAVPEDGQHGVGRGTLIGVDRHQFVGYREALPRRPQHEFVAETLQIPADAHSVGSRPCEVTVFFAPLVAHHGDGLDIPQEPGSQDGPQGRRHSSTRKGNEWAHRWHGLGSSRRGKRGRQGARTKPRHGRAPGKGWLAGPWT